MRILVTGATGYIGGVVAARLCQRAEVFGLGRSDELGRSGEHGGKFSGAVKVDLQDAGALESVVGRIPRCDAIVHAAAMVTNDNYATEVSAINGTGTHQMIALAKQWDAQLVYLSSLQVIGKPERSPIDESHPTRPATAYHASKLFGEHLLTCHQQQSALPTAALRLPAPVGTGLPRGKIFSEFVASCIDGRDLKVLGRGARRQSYLDVRDIAIAVDQCLASAASGTYLIGPRLAISNLELAEQCVVTLNADVRVLAEGTDAEEGLDWTVSCTAAAAAFDFCPKFTLSDSIIALAESWGWQQ